MLGHWGDTHGRKNVLVLCMLLIGASTFCVALLPTYAAVGVWAPILLVILRLIQGFAVGGEISGASAMIIEHSPFGRRGYYGSFTLQGVQAGQIIAAAVFLPLSAFMSKEAFETWGWRIPFLLSARRRGRRLPDPRRTSTRPRPSRRRPSTARCRRRRSSWPSRRTASDMLRVFCMALMNAIPTAVTMFGATFATNAGYGVGLTTTNYLWISVSGNVVAVILIPFVGNLIRQDRPPTGDHRRLPRVRASWPTRTCTSSAEANLRDGVPVRHADVGRASTRATTRCFPSFFQELFPTKTRVTAFAVSQNIGTLITAFLPAIYAALVGPTPISLRRRQEVRPGCVGRRRDLPRRWPTPSSRAWSGRSAASRWRWRSSRPSPAFSARETFRIHLNDLGNKNAVPVPKEEYDRIRKTGVDVAVCLIRSS